MNYLPLVQVHMHTSGSLLDGVGSIKRYIQKAKEYNHPAICCTDHGNAISLYQFYKECKEEKIKPILGCEFYVTPNLEVKLQNKKREVIDRDKHLIVLIKNEQGYKNFCKLIHFSFVDGYYYKPRITFDKLWENKEGLIVCSACAAGPISQLITNEMFNEADEWFKKFKSEFGEDFYAEIQLNELVGKKEELGIDQKEINDYIIKLAKKYKVKTIVSGDIHYADQEDSKLQDIVINCMQRKDGAATEMGQSFIHARRLYYQSSEDFFNFNKEFEYHYDEEFLKECFENSLEIADKCNFDFKFNVNNYPKFPLPEGTDLKKYVTKLAFKGLRKLLEIRIEKGEEFSDELLEQYEKRIEYEIKIIADKGYLDYFLVYHDMIKWGKENKLQFGVGRGCFIPTSKVRLADGSVKEIQDVQIGDKIIGRFGEDEVEFIWIYEIEEELIKLTLENGKEIICTFDHEILTENRDYVKAIDLSREDSLKKINNSFQNLNKIIKKEKITYKGNVIDLKVKNDPSYNIEGVVVHNSAGGSLLSYSLGIIAIDPIEHGLYFERFLNPDRNSPPDIDCDIEQGGRELLRGYLEEKYGKESVYGVMTQTVYQVKSSLQDASRGLGKDTSFQSTLMREITKLPELDDTKNIKEYFDNLAKNNSLSDACYDWYTDNQDTIYWADKLMGLTKNVGTHAGGIVIAPGPIYDYIPVTKAGKEIVTAFRESDGSGHDLSDLGLLKCDVLGLKTLNVIRGCIDDIKKDLGVDISDSINFLDLSDKKLYEKFSKGNNVGIFQMDGSTQNFLIKNINPDCFEDINAINAINRPGPLEAFSKVYGQWKKWEKEGNEVELVKIENERYPFEFMKAPLKRSYGCLLYQEQFMLMVCEAGGLNMGEADSLRRAVGWPKSHPKYYTVEPLFKKLEMGMLNKGYSQDDTELFLDYCRKFMGYSFNLCLTENHTIISKTRGEIKLLEVEIGEEVLAYNTNNNVNEYVVVENIYNSGEQEVYLIKTESGKQVECSLNHFILSEEGKKPLSEILSKKNKIKTKSGKADKIKYKKKPIWDNTPLLNDLNKKQKIEFLKILNNIHKEIKKLDLYDEAVYSIAKYKYLKNDFNLEDFLLHVKLECKNIPKF